MKRALLALMALLWAAPALALPASSIPSKFPLTWGQNAGGSYIRVIPSPSQIGIQNCAASLNDGFPPLTFTPLNAGGCPPFGQDMNGILAEISQWAQWQQAGGALNYDSSFAASISGYPKGTVLQAITTNFGNFWLNLTDNNSSNPDTGGANWRLFSPIYAYAVDAGTANAGSATLPVSTTTIATLTGRPISIKKMSAANTGAYTLALNGTAATAVHHIDGTSLNSGDLPANGVFTVVFDGTFYDLQSPTAAVVLGTAASKNATNNADATVSSVTGTITNNHIAVFADNNGSVSDIGLTRTGSGTALVTTTGSFTTNDILSASDTNGTVKDSGIVPASLPLDWISFSYSGSITTIARSSTNINVARNSTGVYTITESGTHTVLMAIGGGSNNTSLNNSQIIMNANNSSCSGSCTIQVAFSIPSEGSTMTPVDPPTNANVVIFGF